VPGVSATTSVDSIDSASPPSTRELLSSWRFALVNVSERKQTAAHYAGLTSDLQVVQSQVTDVAAPPAAPGHWSRDE
jgi:hypothetical protein